MPGFPVAAALMWGASMEPSQRRVIAWFVVCTAFASVYALLLGYSRVPYAAALDGNYFRIFAHVDPRRHIPDILPCWSSAAVSVIFCTLQLVDLVADASS